MAAKSPGNYQRPKYIAKNRILVRFIYTFWNSFSILVLFLNDYSSGVNILKSCWTVCFQISSQSFWYVVLLKMRGVFFDPIFFEIQQTDNCTDNIWPFVWSTHYVFISSLKRLSVKTKGPFKYYVIKEVGGWGQKMTIFDDLQYYKSSKRWVGGPKKVKNMMT